MTLPEINSTSCGVLTSPRSGLGMLSNVSSGSWKAPTPNPLLMFPTDLDNHTFFGKNQKMLCFVVVHGVTQVTKHEPA